MKTKSKTWFWDSGKIFVLVSAQSPLSFKRPDLFFFWDYYSHFWWRTRTEIVRLMLNAGAWNRPPVISQTCIQPPTAPCHRASRV